MPPNRGGRKTPPALKDDLEAHSGSKAGGRDSPQCFADEVVTFYRGGLEPRMVHVRHQGHWDGPGEPAPYLDDDVAEVINPEAQARLSQKGLYGGGDAGFVESHGGLGTQAGQKVQRLLSRPGH